MLIPFAQLQILRPGASKFEKLTVPQLAPNLYFHPVFLAGGPDLLFLTRKRGSEGEIYLATLREGKVVNPVLLMKNETAARYTTAGGGRVLFVQNDNLYSQRLDIKDRKLKGDAELVQTGVASVPGLGLAQFSVSNTGILAWRPGRRGVSQITEFDHQGNQLGTAGPDGTYVSLRLSPDEKHLLSTLGDNEVVLLEPERPGALSLGGAVGWPVWSPDGARLLGRQDSRISVRHLDGSGEISSLSEAPDIIRLEDISPDGNIALYDSVGASVFSVRLNGGPHNAPVPVVETGEKIYNPRFSPDGHWIIYDARTSENQPLGIYVQPFPNGLRRQIAGSGDFPEWRGDGKEILYLDGSPLKVWSIRVSGSGTDLHFDAPKALFPVRPPVGAVAGLNPLAVSRDGSRIFMAQAVEQPEESKMIHVRAGWLK